VENEAQLSWEARFGRFAAGSAFAAAVFEVASSAFQVAASENNAGRDDPLRYSKTLSNFHDHSDAVLGSAITHGLATIFVAGALFYLFRATRHRRAELPAMVRWLLPIAPVLVTVAAISNWSGLNDASNRFTSAGERANVRASPTKDQRKDIAAYCRSHARAAGVRECRARHEREEAVGKKLVQDNQSSLGTGALFAGSIGLAFLYVIISLNAMRAGLMSRFMGMLGIIVGALLVLPLIPIPIVEIFWLGALGVLFLGIWPGGRGPAWEAGEALPWPTPQQRAGLTKPDDEESPEPEPEAEDVEEPARPHPVSKKRKRKKRR
jgi:hypothetical protein